MREEDRIYKVILEGNLTICRKAGHSVLITIPLRKSSLRFGPGKKPSHMGQGDKFKKVHWDIHSFDKYLLSRKYVPGTALSTVDIGCCL